VRDIFERLFPYNEPFVKAHPSFLGVLELDWLCEELGLAFEYNGVQHEQEMPHFHRAPTAFFEQCERDAIKVVLVRRRNGDPGRHSVFLHFPRSSEHESLH
jgi:hypothetical protein